MADLIEVLARVKEPKRWTEEDTKKEALYAILHGIDWAQTRDAIGRKGYKEANPILGSKPTDKNINEYMAGTLLGHILLSRILPPDKRKLFQNGTIGLELGVTGNNKHVGANIKF